jgi:hypothetical protein
VEAAHIYFGLMAAIMGLTAVLHIWCRDVVKNYPHVMPDHLQRDRFRYMELAMGAACLTVI